MPLTRRHLGLAALFALAPDPAQAQNAGAAAKLQAYDAELLTIMKAHLPTPARVARFEKLVPQYYDMPTIAQLVVGPAWANASNTDRSAVIAALTHHSATQLARNFKSFDGESFAVDPAVVDRGASQIVKVTVQSGSGSDTLLYRVRRTGPEWKIVDVVSGGVSQLAVQRSDLASTLSAGGPAAAAKRLAQLDAAAR